MPDMYARILKFNPYHDRRGRFSSKGNLGKAAAADLHARATQVEPEITADMKAAAGADRMVGLEFAVKGRDSLERKILSDAAEKGMSINDVTRNIGDSVRYTVQAHPLEYSHTVANTLKSLKSRGYELVEFRNSWGAGGAYQGINTNLRHQKTGTVLELQFHTPESFHTKQNVNHKLYEEARLRSTPQARVNELNAIMVANQAKIQIPPGAPRLRF